MGQPEPQISAGLDRAGGGKSRVRNLLMRYRKALREDGPAALASEMRSTVMYQLHKQVLDRLDRQTESGDVPQVTGLDELTIDSGNRDGGTEYVPTLHRVLEWIQQQLPEDKSRWSFIDIGAGRGRVVAAAAAYPYDLVLGIQFASELQKDARAHIAALPETARRAANVDVWHADATTFAIPAGPCIFYLFNPFDADVLRAFLAHVAASHEQHPREMRIAYFNPVQSKVMSEFEQIVRCDLPLSARLKFAALSPHAFELYELN